MTTRGVKKPALLRVSSNLLQLSCHLLGTSCRQWGESFPVIMGVICEKVDDLAELQEAADQDARRNQLRFRDLIKVGFKV